MIEKTKTSSGKFEHVVNPDDSSAFRSSTHSQDKTTEQKSENIKVVDLRDEEDETKGRSKTEPKEWNEDEGKARSKTDPKEKEKPKLKLYRPQTQQTKLTSSDV
jgi:hypothetical protein